MVFPLAFLICRKISAWLRHDCVPTEAKKNKTFNFPPTMHHSIIHPQLQRLRVDFDCSGLCADPPSWSSHQKKGMLANGPSLKRQYSLQFTKNSEFDFRWEFNLDNIHETFYNKKNHAIRVHKKKKHSLLQFINITLHYSIKLLTILRWDTTAIKGKK